MKLLGLCGSLRRESNNKAILQTLASLLKDEIKLNLFPLNDIPLYNADLDGDLYPQSVTSLRHAITECDGIIVCSPEYNYGISGVLKNALDWASRPGFASPLKGKPVLIMTSSPGFTGGVRAQYQIRETFTATLSRPLNRQQVVVAQVGEKVRDGRLVDQTTIDFILAAVDDLAAEIRMVEAARLQAG